MAGRSLTTHWFARKSLRPRNRLRLELLEDRSVPTAVPFFEPPPIDGSFNGATSVSTADLDGDGDMDVLGAAYGDSDIAWWENTAGDGSAWTKRTVDNTFDAAFSVDAADVDGDGDMDVLGAAYFDDDITWWENTAGNGTAWTEHNIDPDFNGAYSVRAADVDGDGDIDVLGAARYDADIAWWENTAGNGTSWTEHNIDPDFNGAVSVYAADVDGDGDLDVLGAALMDSDITWWENTAGSGSTWTEHGIDADFNGAASVYGADMDGDGDMDVLGAAFVYDDITWWENTAGNGSAWTEHTVDPAFDGAWSVSAADVDGDGDVDVLGAAQNDDDITWWENTAGNGAAWTERTVAGDFNRARSVHAADVDGDGDVDILGAAGLDDDIAWFRNDTIHRSAFFGPRTLITLAADGAIAAVAADLDGDGDQDVLSASADDNTIAWYANLDGAGTFGGQQVIFDTALGAAAVHAADLDGDGDLDVLTASVADDRIQWFENTDGLGAFSGPQLIAVFANGPFTIDSADFDGDGDLDVVGASLYDDTIAWYANFDGSGSFTFPQIISFTADMPRGLQAADVDGDGDTDLVAVSENDDKIAWHENVYGTGAIWVEHVVPSVGDEARAVEIADVDTDGDLDIIAAFYQDDRIAWFENLTGSGLTWDQHTITTLANGCYSLSAGDLDRDGDVDVMSADFGGNTLAWYESDGTATPGFTRRVINTVTNGVRKSVHTADIDGDGDLDILSAASDSGFGIIDGIDWFANRGGQFALNTTNTAPATLTNGATDDVLKIVATHRGRAGDHDAELATFDLLFEEKVGDPLTDAQANAMIANLFVYRDFNGNGSFDPSGDIHMTTVADLSLTAGRQIVSFTDGDINVLLAHGAPKTYFIVVELTGNASEQPPGRFRVTHMTASTSTGEDRVADIPLALEFATNVSSPIILAQVQADFVGFVRANQWSLDANGDRLVNEPMVELDDRRGAIPVHGDWDGDGFDEIGAYLAGVWRLDTNGNHVFDVGVDAEFTFGTIKDKPVVGDWDGDGDDEVGLYKKGKWTLDDNSDRILNDVFFKYKMTGALGVVGDWDGDGADEVGLFKKGKWLRDTNDDRLKNDTLVIYTSGQKGIQPVVGDWDADGVDDIGLFLAGNWTLDDGDQLFNAGLDAVFTYGQLGDVSAVGKWRQV